MDRESLEMDVVFVGAGPANLSGALHLTRLVEQHNAAVAKGELEAKPLGEVQIAVIEKGALVGAHILSGAVMDPRGLAELIPDFIEKGAPLESEVKEDQFLDRKSTRLNSSHLVISYAVFCLKKKNIYLLPSNSPSQLKSRRTGVICLVPIV